MSLRFQADADFNFDIVTGVIRREPQVDFQSAEAANLRRLSDSCKLTAHHRHHAMHEA